MAGWCPQQGQLAGTSSLPALPVKGQGHGQSARGPSGVPLACGGGLDIGLEGSRVLVGMPVKYVCKCVAKASFSEYDFSVQLLASSCS